MVQRPSARKCESLLTCCRPSTTSSLVQTSRRLRSRLRPSLPLPFARTPRTAATCQMACRRRLLWPRPCAATTPRAHRGSTTLAASPSRASGPLRAPRSQSATAQQQRSLDDRLDYRARPSRCGRTARWPRRGRIARTNSRLAKSLGMLANPRRRRTSLRGWRTSAHAATASTMVSRVRFACIC